MQADRPSIDLVKAIDSVTVGDYDCFAGHVTDRYDPRLSVTASTLLNEEMQALIKAGFVIRFGHFDARAVHSIWMKWYLNVFLPPFLLADVLLSRALPVALDDVRFTIAQDGRISAVVIDGKGHDTTHADPFERFEGLIFDHVRPLIEIWSARTQVTRRVYWSNVGNTFEAMLCRIEKISGTSPRLQQARRLLSEPFWPDGRANPIFDSVYYVNNNDAMVRRRRVCCLQYLLPDRHFCKACPIEEARAASSATVC